MRQFEQGVSVEDVRGRSPVPMHRTTIYRLLKRVQREGEGAFNDGRHGHPVKLRGEIRAFLLEHCKEQREVLRALEDLKEQERSMYVLDNRKDQVMTVCKVSLANLAMWVRDQYFPAS